MLFEIHQRSVTAQKSVARSFYSLHLSGLDLPVSGDLENEKLRKVLLDRHARMRVRREILRIPLEESFAAFDGIGGNNSGDLQKRIGIALERRIYHVVLYFARPRNIEIHEAAETE